MSAAMPPSRLPDSKALQSIYGMISRAGQVDAVLKRAEPDEVLRYVKGKRVVMSATDGDRRIIIRMYLEDGFECAKRDWAELNRCWPHMNAGPYRVMEPISHVPALGIVVTSFVEGTPFLRYIRSLPKRDRPPCYQGAAAWLRQHMEVSEHFDTPRAARWLKRTDRMAGPQPTQDLIVLRNAVGQETERLATKLKDQKWRYAIGHGDFHANNLLYTKGHLTGIDLGGSAIAPIYRDMARFMVHMATRGARTAGTPVMGIDCAALNTFADVFEMSDVDREVSLPVMIAYEWLIRISASAGDETKIDLAAERYEALLEGLRQY